MLWLGALLLVASALRLPTLGRWSLWMDEAFTIRDAYHMTAGLETGRLAWTYRTFPVNFWLVGQAMRLWGASEFSVRLFPCLAGIASVGVLFGGVRRHAERTTAVLAATFLGVSAWHVFWSQNARHYAPLLLLSSVAAFAGFEAIDRRRPTAIILAITAFVLAALTHPTGLALAGTLVVFFVWRYFPAFRAASARRRLLVILVLLVVGASAVFRAWPIVRIALRAKHGGNLPYFIATVVQFVEIPLLVAAAAGVVPAWRRERPWGLFLAAYALVPSIAFTGGAVAMNLGALYIFTVLPAVCALAAETVVGLSRPPMGSKLTAVVLGAIVLAHQLGETVLYFTHRYGNRPRWREAAAYLQRVGAPSEAIVSTGAPALAYYLDIAPGELRQPDPITWLGAWNIDGVMSSPRQQWLVLKADRLSNVDADGRLREWLGEHGVCVAEFPAWTNVKDRTIRIYRTTP